MRLWLPSLLAIVLPAAAAASDLPPSDPAGNYIVPGVKGGIVYRRVDGGSSSSTPTSSAVADAGRPWW